MNKLWHGDCLELMSQIPDKSIDCIIVDPPYGTTNCKWDSVINFKDMWRHIQRIVKDDGAICIFAQMPFTAALVMSNPKLFRQSLVWSKNKVSGHLNAKRRHMTAHEDICIFSKKATKYFPQKTTGHKKANYAKRSGESDCYNESLSTKYIGGNTDRYPKTILDFNVVNNDSSKEKRIHPSQKPLDLLKYLISTYSNEGDLVLDFAMGSGSTCIACKELNRRSIGIEKDLTIFNQAKERINEN